MSCATATCGLLLLAAALLPSGLTAQAEAPHPPAVGEAAPVPPQGVSPSAARATFSTDHGDAPVATAVRATAPIEVDGNPDEAVWMSAPPVTEFWQSEPDEWSPVSERTEVRFLYDDDALYVGAWLWDADGEFATRLARRDLGLPDTDVIAVHLDSYHDHLTSYRFATNPSGWKRDLIISGGVGGGTGGLGGGDDSWDPVYEVKTHITDEGWFAEFRIPFSQLRFSRAEEQVWGLQLERKLRPGQENTVWSFSPRTDPGGVPRFGHLVGIRGIEPGRRLEVLPYVGGRAEYIAAPVSDGVSFASPFRSGSEVAGSTGIDLKYRITSNLTLDGTVNPDFGQVEVDPAVINLTAFETRYQERRPFFVEGAEIFRFGGGGGGGGFGFGGGGGGGGGADIFYSRRVGRAPQGDVPDASVYDDAPGATTILGAAKLTGKTASGWSVGLLNAVTAREEAPWVGSDGIGQRAEVEPLTNYFVGRVRREMQGGRTSLGGILTATHRDLKASVLDGDLRSTAYAGGVDFGHEWANRAWDLNLQATSSRVAGSPGAMIATQRSSARYFQRPDADYTRVDSSATSLAGYSVRASVRKQAGLWRFSSSASAVSPGYEVNDLGFQTAADRIETEVDFGYEQTRPGRIFRDLGVRLSADLSWNFGGDLIGADPSLFANGQFRNFSRFGARIGVRPSVWDDRLTRGGPLTRKPAGYSGFLNYSTDSNRRMTGQISFNYGGDDAGGWRWGSDLRMSLKASERVELSLRPGLDRSFETAQYVMTRTDPLATETFGRRYLFADLEQTTFSVDTRVNVTLSPEMSFELFLQPFLSSGEYGALKELARPRSFAFHRYGIDRGTITAQGAGEEFLIDPDGAGTAPAFLVDNEDFNYRSLRGNAVFRWEWRPGSTLYLVWQQNRAGTLEAFDPGSSTQERIGNFDFGRDAGELFRLDADNVFLIKVSYWLNP